VKIKLKFFCILIPLFFFLAFLFGAGRTEAVLTDINKVSKKDIITKVLERIRLEDCVEMTQTLVKIPSQYSENSIVEHNEIADFLASYLKKLGMIVKKLEYEEGFPMIVGRLKSQKNTPILALMGHYNTVPIGSVDKWMSDPLQPEIRDGKLFGRGAYDQKSSIAAALIATHAIVESGILLEGELMHTFIPGEGAQDHVLKHAAEVNPKEIFADWYLDTDGGRDIIKVASGHVWLKIQVRGKSAHPGGDDPWINAGYKLAKVLLAFKDFNNWMTYKKHPLFTGLGGVPRVEVGYIRAGEVVNKIPDIAEALIDIRPNPGQTYEGIMKEIHALLDRLKKQDPELNITVEKMPGTQLVPMEYWNKINTDDALIKTIREVAEKRLGYTPKFKGGRGGGRPDLWRIGTKWISWSPTEGENKHAPNECVKIDSVFRTAQVYAEIILQMLL